MDLLRAVIVGAEGTPYHDGLFFFDVFFPCGYPNVPPVCDWSFECWQYIFFCLLLHIIGLNTVELVYARMSTTTLVAFDSILICTIVGRYAWVYLIPGLVTRMRSGSQVYRPCFKFLSPYKGWSWIQSPISTSLDMHIWVAQSLAKWGPSNTMRIHLFSH